MHFLCIVVLLVVLYFVIELLVSMTLVAATWEIKVIEMMRNFIISWSLESGIISVNHWGVSVITGDPWGVSVCVMYCPCSDDTVLKV